jgi:erythronate-4-phosphate dehydrogenase
MLIVADRNVTQADEAFSALGEVRLFSASEITPDSVRDADLLLVRSTVRVGPALLEQSRVRFVATATIGVDHMDVEWLSSRGIAWASAPGCNADSVEQWFAAAVLTLHERQRLDLRQLRIGIVGVGNVGSRIERLCHALALPYVRCDPPRQAREGGDFVALDQLLESSNLVTLHVPLAATTRHLLDPSRLSPGTWLVNASRGEVVDSTALERAASQLGGIVLDVFENEPTPSPSLVAACALATPHIAGHSIEGKLNGTKMVYDAACRFVGIEPAWQPRFPQKPPLVLAVESRSDEALLLSALRSGYHIENDDASLRKIVSGPEKSFRHYRQNYPERHELTGTLVQLSMPRERLSAALTALGATVGSG